MRSSTGASASAQSGATSPRSTSPASALMPGRYRALVSRRCPVWVPILVLVLTVAQLAVAQYVPGIERFADKAFGARLIAYPLLMLVVPFLWWVVVRRRQPDREPPYGAFTLVMLPFLVDVTGNSVDLFDAVVWWDDLSHFANWALLLTGVGLLICGTVRPPWAVVLLVTGLGSVIALGWELGEWYTFIRHGTEIETAYEDTLGDQALGTLGALVAGLVVARVVPQRQYADRGRYGRRPRSPTSTSRIAWWSVLPRNDWLATSTRRAEEGGVRRGVERDGRAVVARPRNVAGSARARGPVGESTTSWLESRRWRRRSARPADAEAVGQVAGQRGPQRRQPAGTAGLTDR